MVKVYLDNEKWYTTLEYKLTAPDEWRSVVGSSGSGIFFIVSDGLGLAGRIFLLSEYV